MLIQVEYIDKKYDFVKSYQLDRLLDMHRIQRFKRSSGWVTVGVDPVRSRRSASSFAFPERRDRA
jgi:hypothetical protein